MSAEADDGRNKIYECAICKRLWKSKVKGIERFKGTRKDVRKHLHDEHNVKGRKNREGANKKEFGQSHLTRDTIAREMK